MSACNHRHRCSRLQRLLDDPRLVVYRPTTAPAGTGDHLDATAWCSSSSVGSSIDTSRSQSHCRISTITDRQPDKKAASDRRFPANSAGRAWAITYPTTEFGRLKSTLTIVSMKHAEHARRDALCESVGGDNIMRSTRMARSGRSPRLPCFRHMQPSPPS
jgi:hypothetical protein